MKTGTLSRSLAVALASVAEWSEHRPETLKVTSSIPSQGTCLGYTLGPGPTLGACKRQPSLTHQCFSPPLSPSLLLSLENK